MITIVLSQVYPDDRVNHAVFFRGQICFKDAFISCAMYIAFHRGFRVNSIELYSLKLI